MSHHSARFYGRPKPPVQFQFVTSKHQRPPGRGRCRIWDNSSVKKLMRAARTGRLPDVVLGMIGFASENAESRHHRYMHRAERQRAADTFMAIFDLWDVA